MSLPEETTKDAVYRMYIKQGMFCADIVAALEGRVKPITVRDYIQEACRAAKERGDEIPMRASPRKKGGFAAFGSQKPLSPLHLTIGNRLSNHRLTVERLQPKAFVQAHDHFTSPVQLRQMEVGVHPFELSQLQKIAEIMGVTVQQLMEPPTGTRR